MSENPAPPNGPDLPLQKIFPPPADIPEKPDGITVDEEQDLEIQRLKEELQGLRNDIRARKTFGIGLFVLICVWLGFVMAVLLMRGFYCMPFWLSDKVLITLLTTTTLNVLGLFAIVANYLFPKTKSMGARKE